jgi:hypothetical protein
MASAELGLAEPFQAVHEVVDRVEDEALELGDLAPLTRAPAR